MKNIHVLPTEKPSRLATHYEKMRLIQTPDMWTYEFTKQNIYITSDEEIKEGDWVLYFKYNSPLIHKVFNPDNFKKTGKKIILTTDQNLIKDGVQAIDDEFLEWFVKNPSCEEVEVKTVNNKWHNEDESVLSVNVYDLIIPKEESKQSTKDRIMSETSEETKQKAKDYGNSLVTETETLEEAANRLFYTVGNEGISSIESFINGAKWQQERSYSEEEVKHLMTLAFEQGFKKADVVEAGLEAKETDTEVNWIFLKHKK
jgi:hypothetical protein